MELNTIRDSFDRVIKKQKLSYSKSYEVADQVQSEITDTLSKIQTIPIDNKSLLWDLKNKLAAISHRNMLEGTLKELNTEVIKYIKLLERNLNQDLSKAYRNVEFDSHTVNQILICHFYREGLFDVGDKLAEEAQTDAAPLRSQYWEMHRILDSLKVKNLDPAMKWIVANREKLNGSGSDLELKLHRLQFIEILRTGSKGEAISYVRTYLSPFASLHMDQVQKLMGSLLWQDKLGSSPYSDLTNPRLWDGFTEELTRQFCCFVGQSYKSPLGVVVSAGFEGLPTLLKLANVMAAKKQECQAMKQLPVDLGKEFQFHSVFVCPVSRDQGTEENPPMLFPCGHVLCKQSILKLSKNSTRSFKCPYCPADASATQCRQLYL